MIRKLHYKLLSNLSVKNSLCSFAFIGLMLAANSAKAQYCDSPWDAEYEYITNVTFAGINNTTAGVTGFAQNFTAMTAQVNIGTSYPISVTTVGTDDEQIDVFVDWNQNGILNDPGEVYTIVTDATESGTYTYSITPPADALLGTTRMRAMVVYLGSFNGPDPCESFFGFGEVEDYSVTVSQAMKNASFDLTALKAYPNPTKDILNVNYNAVINQVKIYNLIGQEVLSQNTSDATFEVNTSTLSTGTYVVKLFTNDAQHTFKFVKE